MMDFDLIWPRFNWVIAEMRQGMCFFEGYIPSLQNGDLLEPLTDLRDRADSHSLERSIWASDTMEADWNKIYELAEYVDFFDSGKINLLHFDYGVRAGDTDLSQKLMFLKDEQSMALEIICYREPILDSSDPKMAIADAISEFGRLKQLFRGDALFIGPDTLNYPENPTNYPKEWLRIE